MQPIPNIALITGANRGLGPESARRYGQTGGKVIVAARSAESGQETAAVLCSEQIDAEAIVLDVHEFLPLLRESRAGRIVNVSTTMGSLNEQLNPESPYYDLIAPPTRGQFVDQDGPVAW